MSNANVTVTINIFDEDVAWLQDQAMRLGVTVTSMICRCIATESFMQRQHAAGNKLLVQFSDGRMFNVTRSVHQPH